MNIYYDFTAGRGNYDDDDNNHELELFCKNYDILLKSKSTSRIKRKSSNKNVTPMEWKPTSPKKNGQSSANIPIRPYHSQNTSPYKNSSPKSRNNRNKGTRNMNAYKKEIDGNKNQKEFIIGSKFSSQTKLEDVELHSSFSVPSQISKLCICTQSTVDLAPSSLVFFTPVRISGKNALIIALKHDMYLKKKNYNKTFNTMSSKSLFSQKIITSSSVFELRPYNDTSSL